MDVAAPRLMDIEDLLPDMDAAAVAAAIKQSQKDACFTRGVLLFVVSHGNGKNRRTFWRSRSGSERLDFQPALFQMMTER